MPWVKFKVFVMLVLHLLICLPSGEFLCCCIKMIDLCFNRSFSPNGISLLSRISLFTEHSSLQDDDDDDDDDNETNYLHLEFSMSPATASTFLAINGFSHQFSSLHFHHTPQTGPANKKGLFKKYHDHWVCHCSKLIIITYITKNIILIR